jgi:hypothetical protein
LHTNKEMSFSTFFEDARNIGVIDNAIITAEEFVEFCTALNLSSSERMRLTSESSRNYLALRSWLREHRTRRDFAAVLVAMRNKKLASDLGFLELFEELRQGGGASKPVVRVTFSDLTMWQRHQIATEIAMYWANAAAKMGIDPEHVKMELHGGATPMEGSQKFVEKLYYKNQEVDSLIAALKLCSLNKQALFVQEMREGVAPLPTTVEAPKSGARKRDNMSMQVDGDGIESTSKAVASSRSKNPFASKPKKAKTVRAFVRDDGVHYRKLCMVLNDADSWRELLNMHQLDDAEDSEEQVERAATIAKLVGDIESKWKKRQNNPAAIIFELLIDTDFGDLTQKELQEKLKTLPDAAVSAVVQEWIKFEQEAIDKRAETTDVTFAETTTLRKTLLDNKIATDKDVDDMIARLAAPAVDCRTIEDLRELDAQELSNVVGWSLIRAKKCVRILKEMK